MYSSLKPTILIITSYLPYPLNVGGKIRIYTLCKNLSHKYNFILLSLVNNENELRHLSELKKLFKEVHCVIERSNPKSIFHPHAFLNSYSEALIRKFKELQTKIKIDLIHIESNELLYLTEYKKDIPLVFTEHDISILSLKNSYYRSQRFLIGRFFDYLKKLRFHKKYYKRVSKVITLSEFDKQIVKNFIPDNKIFCIPTGVDLDYFYFQPQRQVLNRLIFVGWYLHYPNEDAVLYFSKTIFPLLKKKSHILEFLIIGTDPTQRIIKLSQRDGFKVIGEVVSVRDYLNDSTIFINPTRLGYGIRSKLLEAMSSGLPVVSTARGACGIKARGNIELLLADRPGEFANQVLRLLNDNELRTQIAVNARGLVEQNYDWRKITAKLDNVYRQTI